MRRGIGFTFTASHRYPGDRIGVRKPDENVVPRLRSQELPDLLQKVEQAENDDETTRRVVETIAMLRADGVPRDLLLEQDAVARLLTADLLHLNGDLVQLDPTLALAVRLRTEDTGRIHDVITAAGALLYGHATDLRLPASSFFHEKD